ncbi:signal peptidase II [Alkaliphilus hydrothermalis]|uniref:Lipoprotein signal peptidase n=1 Tax=Alkaliphilus hydrothermalis TaxID=1482730 RepID=A0ABS2NTI9_9FIRM|nr:signal peptidase II [Alkaliphilus hydrothermalis]MBM7616270.1 lipoprotein signal peptidase [Alkaliphilus hydrothermalis]
MLKYKNLLICLGLISLDQIIKMTLKNCDQIVIIKNILSIDIYGNGKMSLGIALMLFSSITILIAIMNNYNFINIGIFIIFAGVSSNLIDLLLIGFVIDWINLGSRIAFNLADVYILLGIVVITRKFSKT